MINKKKTHNVLYYYTSSKNLIYIYNLKKNSQAFLNFKIAYYITTFAYFLLLSIL